MKAKVGDWIRFYNNGILVIGVVEYLIEHDVLHDLDYATDKGRCSEDSVLEVRTAKGRP